MSGTMCLPRPVAVITSLMVAVFCSPVSLIAGPRWPGGGEIRGASHDQIPPGKSGLDERPPAESRGVGPDMTFCQLFGLGQWGRVDDIVGLALQSTAWNIGDVDLPWEASPDPAHPLIIMSLFRLKTVDGSDRFEQIGQSWARHGWYALGSAQCGGTCGTYGGDRLGPNCTTTSGASPSADPNRMGPPYEVNPWTRGWTYEGSHSSLGYHEHDAVQHRLQVHDADLDASQNSGATYYAGSFYVCPADVQQMNSASWKPVTVSSSPGTTWFFGMSGMGTAPEGGVAIDAWPEAMQTILAEEIPVVEFVSPDGRCVLAAKATELGGNIWHYEYALLNVDMDRKAGSFSIPVRPDANVTNVAFHAVAHHGEEEAGYSNEPWSAAVGNGAVTWSTMDNPVRWGTMYNFRFDADLPPAGEGVTVTLGLYESGTPSVVNGTTVGPCDADGDLDANGGVDGGDIQRFVDALIIASTEPEELCSADFEINRVIDMGDLPGMVDALLAQ